MDAILNWIWQGSLIAAVTAILLLVLRRSAASVRYAVCWAALAAIVALPILAALGTLAGPVTSSERVGSAGPAAALTLPAAPDGTAVLLVMWMAWSLIFGARAVLDGLRIRRAKRAARPFPPERERRLPRWSAHGSGGRGRLVVSDCVTAAAVLGVRTPVIALSPQVVEELGDEEVDLVVMHEWMHLERRDEVANLLQVGVRLIAGWHPAMWWIDRRLHAEREAACDERTVDATGSPRAYAACLVKLAEIRTVQAPLPVPGALGSTGLSDRVARVLRYRPRTSARRAGPAVAALVLPALAAALAPVQLVASGVPVGSVATAARGSLDLPAARRSAGPEVTEPRVSIADAAPRPPARPVARSTVDRGDAVEPPVAMPVALSFVPDLPFGTAGPPEPPMPAVSALPEPPVANGSLPLLRPHGGAAEEPSGPDSRTGWLTFADAGAAIGNTSQQAATSTARFLTKVGRGIAGAF